jgi:DNA-binding MarR family transcriptional regulator
MPDTFPERQRTLGSLLRLPYNELQDAVYGALPDHGFRDLRVAHSAVFRHMDPSGTRMTTLAERAGMTKQSMAYLVENLRDSDYLTVVSDPADGRAKLVQLTSRGMQAVETLLRQSQQFEDWLADAIGTTNMSQLRSLLEQVSLALEQRKQE